MSMFNDIDWTKQGNYNESFSKSEKVKDFAKRFPLGHWSFLGQGDEENGMERTITNLKDSAILLQMSRLPISKTVHIQYSELPVRWTGILEKRKVDDVRFTSVLNLRTQIFFYFALFTMHIISVSTEQSRVGVMN